MSTRLFNARDGLPDNKVAFLLETHKSPYRWAITRNELCRFDGYRFQTVWEQLPDILVLAENSKGNLLMSHIGVSSISCFDPTTGKKTKRDMASIPGLEGNFRTMWAQDTMIFLNMESSSADRLNVYRLYPDFTVRLLHSLEWFPNAWLWDFYTFLWDEKNKALWYENRKFIPDNAIVRLDTKTSQVRHFVHNSSQDENFHLLLGFTPEGNVYNYSLLTGEYHSCNEAAQRFDPIAQQSGIASGIRYLGTDEKGAILVDKTVNNVHFVWLRRADGSSQELKGEWTKLHFNSASGSDFSRQIYFSCLEGVLRVNIEKPIFNYYAPVQAGNLNIAFRGIAADPKGAVWLLAEMTGLFRMNPSPGHQVDLITQVDSSSKIKIPESLGVDLQTDAKGNLWSVREGGSVFNLMRQNPFTGISNGYLIETLAVTAFRVLKNGSILLGGHDSDPARILLYDPETRQTRHLYAAEPPKSSDTLKAYQSQPLFLLENSAGKIWVGNKEGLFLFDPVAQKMLDFPGNSAIAHEFPVSVIFAEGDSVLWCGTLGGGLRKLNVQTGKWAVFTMANGLPANKIAGILQDENRNLWISTYDGLSFFQPESKLFTNFFTANGLSHNEFNRFSFFRSADGTMYFGGLNGVNYFKPSEVLGSFAQGSDSLLISQVAYFASDGKTRLEQVFDLQNLQKITLPADNRYCSIRLALANYLQPEANRFAWKLEGYDADWHLNGTNNEITFHYLPAGKYRLRIKAANPTGIWGKNEHAIEIEVKEFWYKTWWAFGLLVAAVLGLFFWYYRYQVKQKLEQAETLRIKELDALKSRLYTNITHEFRTPLTVILGMADEIEDLDGKGAPRGRSDTGQPTTSPISNAVNLIRRNGKNLLRLINQLLDLSKLDSGLMKMQLVQADIIGYLQYLTESFYSMAQERKVRLTFYPETPNLVMDFDEEKIQVIAYNLLSNALKFTGEGGKVVLHASQIEQNGAPFLQLKVQDTGVGIAEKELTHIFDRFYQADNSTTRKGEGTGIGLTLVKELVELMEGSIRVESILGKGTTFTLLLPIKQEAETQAAPPTQQKLPTKPNPPITNPPITNKPITNNPITNPDKPLLLIVEDNADVVTYIHGILKNDYQIETAANGKIGIEKALEMVPDIIISDVMMPEKDGYEVCETLKNDERTSHIPIILLTAKATQEDKVTGLRVGADAYLQKPFDKAELFVRLEKLVELRQRLQARYIGGKTDLPSNKNLEGLEPAAPTLDDIFLQKIRQVIETKMSDTELGILHLCRAANLSHTQVFRKMKALTGENPTLYIRKMRLQRAHHLLKATEMNVSEIAYEVGFSDPNYFSRSFHEEFGEAPSAMRK